MVSDFIDELAGYFALSEEEVKRDQEDPTVPLLAREVIEVGAKHDGYYDSETFCLQVAKAAALLPLSTLLKTLIFVLFLIMPRPTQHILLMNSLPPE